ncbi:hypothetical protein ACL02T_08095 [Pseudonocardia sp. RS010]|uniref:hypothetical protein n=1 Tax=Pseudonocardia sp. RS010 TaxID=3385979 RepID=UPI0039A2465B
MRSRSPGLPRRASRVRPARHRATPLRVRDMLMALAMLLVVVAVGGGVRSSRSPRRSRTTSTSSRPAQAVCRGPDHAFSADPVPGRVVDPATDVQDTCQACALPVTA